MKKMVSSGLVCLLSLTACSTSSEAPKPAASPAIEEAFFDYTLEVGKARLLQRKCPELAMNFDGLMAELRSRPQLAGSQGRLSADSIDKGRLADAFDRFEKQNGLYRADQSAYCAFGKKQIAAKTRTGRLLQLRSK
ncbi:hypothetical protein D4A92_12345 [Rhizobium rosettiformans]|uniref:Lipoprotein n=2 Tax=Rhizobium/Agrobacterium group TaxID=227290 RepID=A0ABX7EXP4_9HYPH|nr:hypothetical protein D4A92_12345 [Rhizobium rosettiformans]